MLRIGTKQPQGKRGNPHFGWLLTQTTDQKGLNSKRGGAGRKRLLDRTERTEKALVLHDNETAGMGRHPFGLVRLVEDTLPLE
jgi:hypothetical protein